MTEDLGTTMTLESMRSTFNVKINVLQYFRIRKLIKSFTSNFKDENPRKKLIKNLEVYSKLILKWMCLIRDRICGKMSSNLNRSICHFHKMYIILWMIWM